MTSSMRQLETSVKSIGKDMEKMITEIRQTAKYQWHAIQVANGMQSEPQQQKIESKESSSSSDDGADGVISVEEK